MAVTKTKKKVAPFEHKIIVEDNQERKILIEGRSRGMGFAFLKQEDENKFTTVQPISPCKDYLNDVVYSEATGKPCAAHGLSYKKQNIFHGEYGYLAMKICLRYVNEKYHDYESDVQRLDDNYESLQEFINIIEMQLKLPVLTEIEKVDDLYLVRLPMYWCKYTYTISLYTLLLRVGVYWDKNDPFEWLATTKQPYDDVYSILSALPKLKKMIEGNPPIQNMKEFRGGHDVHGCGIVSFNF